MKERRRGLGRAAGVAEGVAAAVRRRQLSREPRVLVYDELGHPHLLPPDTDHRERMLELCERMVALTVPREPEEPEVE